MCIRDSTDTGDGPRFNSVFLVVQPEQPAAHGPFPDHGPTMVEECRLGNCVDGVSVHGAGNNDGELPVLAVQDFADAVIAPRLGRHLHLGPGLIGDSVGLERRGEEGELGRKRSILPKRCLLYTSRCV